jgi:ABC-type Zn2+ transport system substrate-binding protein/surface adhesin
MGEECVGGVCNSNKEKKEHSCGCGHNHEHKHEHKHEDCGCGHNHKHNHEGCGCHAEHGHAHVKMTPKEELDLLTKYKENLETEKDLVEKRIQELKSELKK